MDDNEEYELLEALKQKDLHDVAEKMRLVIDKRDRKFDETHDTISDCNKRLTDQIVGINTNVTNITAQLTDMHVELRQHMEHEELQSQKEAKLAEERYHKLFDAFPNKDARGHRDAHLEMIEAARTAKDFRKRIVQHIITIAVTAVVGFVAAAVWTHFQSKVHDHTVQQPAPKVRSVK